MDSRDLSAAEHAIEEAVRAMRELAHLQAQERVARDDLGAAEETLATASGRLDREAADVATLESWSPTRIWAGLRGDREAKLSREEAELQAAQYAVATAQHRRACAAVAVDELTASMRALGDPEARYRTALDDMEHLLVSTETGPSGELVELAERLGELAAERREIGEADAAGSAAFDHLGAAVELLEKARSWSTYDTFGGGGMLTDAMKYDRMDRAAAALSEADLRLRRLRVELADVDLSGVPDVAVSGLLRTFDMWFDNIFSDWGVRSRIIEALEAATRARADVQQVAGVLRGRRDEVESETERLTARRTEILTGG